MIKVNLTQVVVNSRGIEGYNEETATVTINASSVEKTEKENIRIYFENRKQLLIEYEKFNVPYGQESYPCKVERYFNFIECTPFANCKLAVKSESFFETI